jgi:hypothetical protein
MAAAAAACLGWLMLPAPFVLAQDAAPPPPQPRPRRRRWRRRKQPGVFEAIGRWFDEGASNFRDHLRGAKRKMDDLNDDAAANSKGFSDQARPRSVEGAADATKNAMDAVAKLPTARMMNGRERCANAPNGRPTASRRPRRSAASTAIAPARAWISPRPRNVRSRPCWARRNECTP